VVSEGVGQGGEMTQALYVHMNNKIKKRETSHENPKEGTIITYLFAYIIVSHVSPAVKCKLHEVKD
jgi:hypothetical protein